MGIFDSIERGLERAVNGAFAKTFRGGVQPVEISAALKRELDVQAVAVDRDRVLAPNLFTVRLAQKDLDRLQQYGPQLISELEHAVTKHAGEQGYQLLGPAVITLQLSNLPAGTLEISAQQPDSRVSWNAVLEVAGVRHSLRVGTSVVGRGSDCDIRISDSAASRRHLEILWDGQKGLVRDLGSTNGSKIDGQRFREAQLQPDMVIYIGQTPLRFRFAPIGTPAAAAQQAVSPSFWEVS